MKKEDKIIIREVRELLNSSLNKSYYSDAIETLELDRLIVKARDEADRLLDKL